MTILKIQLIFYKKCEPYYWLQSSLYQPQHDRYPYRSERFDNPALIKSFPALF